jgi:hypothetical protein
MKRTFWSMVLLLVSLNTAWAQSSSPVAHDASRAQAKRMLEAMQMGKTMDRVMQNVLQAQLDSNPNMLEFKEDLEFFFKKHLSYEATFSEIVELYAETYSADEMVEITRFYQSPVGQRTLELMPELAARSQQIGIQRVEDNKAELVDMVLKRIGTIQP